LDTCVFIYSLEKNPNYVLHAREVFTWIEQPGHSAVTSTVTMTEILVKPYRTLEPKAVRLIHSVLLTYPNLEWVIPDLEIADTAAELRATYRLKTADALQAATAARSGATLFVTNDASFERIGAFETLLLDRLL
jgi:predicted nucleic acid-binding protein